MKYQTETLFVSYDTKHDKEINDDLATFFKDGWRVHHHTSSAYFDAMNNAPRSYVTFVLVRGVLPPPRTE